MRRQLSLFVVTVAVAVGLMVVALSRPAASTAITTATTPSMVSYMPPIQHPVDTPTPKPSPSPRPTRTPHPATQYQRPQQRVTDTPTITSTETVTITSTSPSTTPTVGEEAYLPLIQRPPPTPTSTSTPTVTPSPTMTPTPPPLSSIVIQPFQVSSSYTIDEFREVKNDEAAKSYPDPKAALAAFVQQGRESSWFVRYLSSFLNPLGISDQGIRYLTPEGADAGLDYTIADIKTKHPDYVTYPFFSVGDRSVAIRWGFISNGKAYYQYFYAIRKWRYVAVVQVLGYQADLTASIAHSYARTAADRLP